MRKTQLKQLYQFNVTVDESPFEVEAATFILAAKRALELSVLACADKVSVRTHSVRGIRTYHGVTLRDGRIAYDFISS